LWARVSDETARHHSGGFRFRVLVVDAMQKKDSRQRTDGAMRCLYGGNRTAVPNYLRNHGRQRSFPRVLVLDFHLRRQIRITDQLRRGMEVVPHANSLGLAAIRHLSNRCIWIGHSAVGSSCSQARSFAGGLSCFFFCSRMPGILLPPALFSVDLAAYSSAARRCYCFG